MTARSAVTALAVAASSALCLASGCAAGGHRSPSTSTSSTPPSPSTSTGAPGGPRACTTAQLTVSVGTGGAAAGTFVAPFVVKDSGAPCTLTGYFGLALLNASGRPLGPSPIRDPGITESTAPVGTVVVGGASTAVFAFQWPYEAVHGETCPMPASVELTAPDQSDHITIAARTAGGQGIALCGDGQTYIGPVTASG